MSALDQDYDFSARVEDDDELESRWAEPGLEPGFERFYREHYAFVWRSARRMLVGAGDDRIEDVLQDTWMTAYRRFDSFAGECRPTTWLFGILRNIVRNHERGERRHNRRVAAFVEHERERERSRGADDTTRLLGPKLLEGFLRTLDEDKRAVFVLAELEGHSGREIAQALHINANTAQSRLLGLLAQRSYPCRSRRSAAPASARAPVRPAARAARAAIVCARPAARASPADRSTYKIAAEPRAAAIGRYWR